MGKVCPPSSVRRARRMARMGLTGEFQCELERVNLEKKCEHLKEINDYLVERSGLLIDQIREVFLLPRSRLETKLLIEKAIANFYNKDW